MDRHVAALLAMTRVGSFGFITQPLGVGPSSSRRIGRHGGRPFIRPEFLNRGEPDEYRNGGYTCNRGQPSAVWL